MCYVSKFMLWFTRYGNFERFQTVRVTFKVIQGHAGFARCIRVWCTPKVRIKFHLNSLRDSWHISISHSKVTFYAGPVRKQNSNSVTLLRTSSSSVITSVDVCSVGCSSCSMLTTWCTYLHHYHHYLPLLVTQVYQSDQCVNDIV